MTSRLGLLARGRVVAPDLAAIVALEGLTIGAVLVPGISATPLRVMLGLPFVLFAPGYALLAAAFPVVAPGAAEQRDDARLDIVERVALAFGLSVTLVVLVGLVLTASPWGLSPSSTVACLSAITLGGAAVGAYRRRTVAREADAARPATDRRATGDGGDGAPTRRDSLLTLALGLGVVVATVGVGYAVVGPHAGESYTELYLLTDDPTGDASPATELANGTLTPGTPLTVVVESHERTPTTYAVVVQRHELGRTNGTRRVTSRARLYATQLTLAPGESWRRLQPVDAPTDGVVRLAVYLYRGDAPSAPTANGAAQHVHVWVTTANETG